MPYSVTTASSPDDVIVQMLAFAVANGFTDQGSVVYADTGFTPNRNVNLRRVSLGSVYWTFCVDPRITNTTPIRLIKGRMSYSIGSSYPTSSNGQQYWTGMSLFGFGGPYSNLYLYCDGVTPAVHAVVELAAGIYNHMSFGMIEKTDTFTGGEYISGGQYQYQDATSPFLYAPSGSLGTSYNSPHFVGSLSPTYNAIQLETANGTNYIRSIPNSGAANNFNDFAVAGYSANSQYASFGGYGGISDRLTRDSPNLSSLRTPLFPLLVQIYDPVSGLFRMAGRIPGARIAAINYVDPAEVILSQWQCFPMTQKYGSRVACPDSGKYGFAYKRVS